MSEIVLEDNGTRTEEDLKNLAAASSLIVILHNTQKSEKVREVTFPQETHYLRSQVTQYIEDAQIYRVKKILKQPPSSGAKEDLKVGDMIRVLTPNVFTELDYQLTHEQGRRKSPLIPYKKSMFPQKIWIAFYF